MTQQIERHTLSVLVDNEPGVLARVIGLFSGRGYNIESLTVSETEHEKHLSRITIVTTGTPMVIEQIKNQLDRLVPVHRVVDLTVAGRAIERELRMVKVRGTGENRVEALRLADAFRARVVDAVDRELRVRDDRPHRQDRRLRQADAAARPGRGVAHRRRRDLARAGRDVEERSMTDIVRPDRRGFAQAWGPPRFGRCASAGAVGAAGSGLYLDGRAPRIRRPLRRPRYRSQEWLRD